MTMNKISNEQALSFIDSFLGKVEWKKSEESPITVKPSDVGGANLAGTEKAKVSTTTDTSPGKTDKEEKAKEGEHGKEKSSDLAAAVPGTSVENAKAENNESKDKEHASTGDFGAEPTDDKGQDLAAEVQNKLKVAEEKPMQNELRRAENLGNRILAKVSAMQEAVELQKQAKETETLLKTAAEEAYHDFVISYQYGLLKRAEDEAAIQQALGVSPEEASGMLDEIAAEDPNAVMPAEAMPAEGAPVEAVPEEAAVAEGAPEGDEASAAELVDALAQLGISPEEIAQAAQQVDAEGAAAPEVAAAPEAAAAEAIPAEGMPVAAAEKPAVPPVKPPMKEEDKKEQKPPVAKKAEELTVEDMKAALPKTAAERNEFVKEVVRNFRASIVK